MKILLLLLMVSSQQLTWYELYERGEKSFNRAEYADCISDMEAALTEKPEPGLNQFTRAVQKIDYKPYYFLALSYFKQGDLARAFDYAQKSFAGEVVRKSPILQSDLAPILEAYRSQVQEMHLRYTEEEALITKRSNLIASLSEGKTEVVLEYLNSLENEDMFKDIRMHLALLETWKQGRDEVQKEVLNQLDQWIEAGEVEKARQLLDSLQNHLPQDTVAAIRTRLDAIPKEEPAPPDQEPDLQTVESPEPEESEPVVDPTIVDFYQKELARVERQKQELDQQVASINNQNKQLRGQLLDKKAAQPSFVPQLVLNLFSEKRKAVRIEGHAVSPLMIRGWELLIDGNRVGLPESALSQNGAAHRLDLSKKLPSYGDHTVEIRVVDEMSRRVSRSQTIHLPLPWFLNMKLWVILGAILIAWVLIRFALILKRRRKAKLLHFNPYIAGSPVREEEMFYGRDELVHRIQSLVHKNSFMIHGARRIGKTSLLFQLHANLKALSSENYKFFPALIDLQGVHEPELFHHMMAEVLSNAEDWELETEDLTFREIPDHYQSRQFSRDMKHIIHTLQERHPQHVMVVLLVDEVDVLNEFSEKTNQKLRGIFMKDYAEHLTCVMAGIHLKKEWESSGSPWYNFFEEIPIHTIDEKEATRLILDPVKGIFQYKKDAVNLIIKETGCHPYLIQKVCVSLIVSKLHTGHYIISKSDVAQALKNLNEEFKRSRA